MQKTNFSRETEKIIKRISDGQKDVPRLLLHSCCAPCSSHVMEYLREYFALTVFYYNPNITVSEEYEKRLMEEKRLIEAYNRQVEIQDWRPLMILRPGLLLCRDWRTAPKAETGAQSVSR